MPARTATTLPVAATVGTNLAKLRTWHHMSILDLANRTKTAGHYVNWDALSQIERGTNRTGGPRAVTVDQLAVFAAVFHVSPQQLLDPTFEPRPLPPRSASARGPQNVAEKRQNGA